MTTLILESWGLWYIFIAHKRRSSTLECKNMLFVPGTKKQCCNEFGKVKRNMFRGMCTEQIDLLYFSTPPLKIRNRFGRVGGAAKITRIPPPDGF